MSIDGLRSVSRDLDYLRAVLMHSGRLNQSEVFTETDEWIYPFDVAEWLGNALVGHGVPDVQGVERLPAFSQEEEPACLSCARLAKENAELKELVQQCITANETFVKSQQQAIALGTVLLAKFEEQSKELATAKQFIKDMVECKKS